MSSGFAERSNQKLLKETLMDLGEPANITSIKQEIFNKIDDNVSRRLIGNVIRETLQTGVETGDIQKRGGKYFVNKLDNKRKAENEPDDAPSRKASKGNRSVLSDDEDMGRSRSRSQMVRKRSSSKSITVKRVRSPSKSRRASKSRKSRASKSPRRRSRTKSRSKSRRSASKSKSRSRSKSKM